MKKIFWGSWLILTFSVFVFWMYKVFLAEDKSSLLIGEASHGHYQIEMSCETCHASSFTSPEDLQLACVNCHGAELKSVDDSHPKSKFTDPRNADRVELLDARYCVTCHTEHQQEYTLDMGLTVPADFCFHCHQGIAEERPSHKDLAYDSCASAGCHNFHDNKALYEDFLLKHAHEPDLREKALLPGLLSLESLAAARGEPLSAEKMNMPLGFLKNYQQDETENIVHEWLGSAHAKAGVNCLDCHESNEKAWLKNPTRNICINCHEFQVEGFYAGKHGMRLSPYLDSPQSPLKPEMSKLDFKDSSMSTEQGCNTCHGPHDYDIQEAAVEGCLACHDDEHSRAYKSSAHFSLWEQELAGNLPPGSGVSCASCHMPRHEVELKGEKRYTVEHNQNLFYRPNEKMVRPVCMHCHGVGFILNALADDELINNNFQGPPETSLPIIDWVIQREEQGEGNESK